MVIRVKQTGTLKRKLWSVFSIIIYEEKEEMSLLWNETLEMQQKH